MDDPPLMKMGQGRRNLPADGDRLGELELFLLPELVTETLTLDKLEAQKMATIFLVKIVDRDYIWVPRPARSNLPPKPLQGAVFDEFRVEDLDRDLLPNRRIQSAEDRPGPATTEQVAENEPVSEHRA
jgi:hypothetical protein